MRFDAVVLLHLALLDYYQGIEEHEKEIAESIRRKEMRQRRDEHPSKKTRMQMRWSPAIRWSDLHVTVTTAQLYFKVALVKCWLVGTLT